MATAAADALLLRAQGPVVRPQEFETIVRALYYFRCRMPNIASVLKAEISRVARKELRAETDSLKKATTTYRREIAALKKRIAALEKQVKRGTRAAPKKEEGGEVEGRQLRFSAARLAAQRQKLGLSAAAFARLIGVSPLSVYKWEAGKSRPRRAQLEAIAAARGLGKREAQERLEALAA